jgi:hypothetical protein
VLRSKVKKNKDTYNFSEKVSKRRLTTVESKGAVVAALNE